MRILGIDPGTVTMGYGLVRATPEGIHPLSYGVVSQPASRKRHVRLFGLLTELRRIMADAEPTIVAIESGYVGQKNKRTSITIGEGKAIAEILAAELNLGVIELSPAQVKKTVAGNGNASKERVRTALGAWMDPVPCDTDLNATDALAVAIAAALKVDAWKSEIA